MNNSQHNSITVVNEPVIINIAPDATYIESLSRDEVTIHTPDEINITFWNKDGSFKETISIDQLIHEAGREE